MGCRHERVRRAVQDEAPGNTARRLQPLPPFQLLQQGAAQAGAEQEPLLPLEAIVLAFLLPPSLIAALLALAPAIVVSPAVLAAVVAVASVPPTWAVFLTWKRSRRRNDLLTEMAKHREFLRERGGKAA